MFFITEFEKLQFRTLSLRKLVKETSLENFVQGHCLSETKIYQKKNGSSSNVKFTFVGKFSKKKKSFCVHF